MIKDLYIDIFRDGIIGCILGIIIWIFSLMLLTLISWGIFYIVDSSFLPTNTSVGNVINKKFSPAYYTTTYIRSGNATIPVTRHIPNRWYLTIEINNMSDDVNVESLYYNNTNIGDNIECEYVKGRFSDYIYIEKIK